MCYIYEAYEVKGTVVYIYASTKLYLTVVIIKVTSYTTYSSLMLLVIDQQLSISMTTGHIQCFRALKMSPEMFACMFIWMLNSWDNI